MRALAVAALLTSAAPAFANGRNAQTSTINFRRGHNEDIAAGMSFGFVISHDNGATWHWMCEDALHYGGEFDPVYVYTEPGDIFATTHDGALENKDGCSWDATAFGTGIFVSAISQGSDGAIYVGLNESGDASMGIPADSRLYISHDNGETFPIVANPGQAGDSWKSFVAAPSDPQRVYAAGFHISPTVGREHLLFRSDDGGHTFAPMSKTGLVLNPGTTVAIVGISKTNPDVLYAHLDQLDATNPDDTHDGIFKSTDGGASWTMIIERTSTLFFVARANGDLVASTQLAGSWVSHDDGATWLPLVMPPHINCLAENEAGEVWACTVNKFIMGNPMQVELPSDDAGIMKSTDLATWTPVLRFQDIKGPVDCPAGTIQRDKCTPQWCMLRTQLAVTENPTCCPPILDGEAVTPGCPDGMGSDDDDPSCCGTSSSTGPTTALLSGLVVGGVLLHRRRRRR